MGSRISGGRDLCRLSGLFWASAFFGRRGFEGLGVRALGLGVGTDLQSWGLGLVLLIEGRGGWGVVQTLLQGGWILRIGLLGILHHNYIRWHPPRIVLVVI